MVEITGIVKKDDLVISNQIGSHGEYLNEKSIRLYGKLHRKHLQNQKLKLYGTIEDSKFIVKASSHRCPNCKIDFYIYPYAYSIEDNACLFCRGDAPVTYSYYKRIYGGPNNKDYVTVMKTDYTKGWYAKDCALGGLGPNKDE